MMNNAILFIDLVKPEHIPIIVSVYKKGFIPIVNLGPNCDELKKSINNIEIFENHFDESDKVQFEKKYQNIANQINSTTISKKLMDVFFENDGKFTDNTYNKLINKLLLMVRKELFYITVVEKLLKIFQIKLGVFGYDNSHTQRVSVLKLKDNGITTLQLAHGQDVFLVNGEKVNIAGGLPHYTDYQAVFGDASIDVYKKIGYNTKTIIPVGAPHFDVLYENDTTKNEASKKLGLNPQLPTILWAGTYAEGNTLIQYYTDKFFTTAKNLLAGLSDLSEEIQLIIRPHPLEITRYNYTLEEQKVVVGSFIDWVKNNCNAKIKLIYTTEKILSIIASDVVFVDSYSTFITEIMILNRGVIIDPAIDKINPFFTEEMGISILEKKQELTELLRSYLFDPLFKEEKLNKYSNALKKMNFRNDGQASKRVSELVVQMANKEFNDSNIKQKNPSIHIKQINKKPKVLLAYRKDVDHDGGAGMVMKHTHRSLQELNFDADISYDSKPNLQGYDIIHAFNIWAPNTALAQLKYFKQSGKPIVWMPFYLHWCEYIWANASLNAIYGQDLTVVDKETYLSQFYDGTLVINGMNKYGPNEVLPSFKDNLTQMIECVNHICFTSYREAQTLFQFTKSNEINFSITPHGVNNTSLNNEKAFQEKYGIEHFVLCIGSIDVRKNQLLLIHAIKETNLRLVLIGPCYEKHYLEYCLKEGGEQVTYLGKLNQEMVFSALKAAAVHVLPSYAEGAALVNMEAAISETPLVVSNRSSEFEYFEHYPIYCDPTDPKNIREAIFKAITSGANEPERWQSLSRHVRNKYTWKNTAELTINAYKTVLNNYDC
jgi:glycosyltransferase involved in cell wall biosynthesis